MDIKIKNIVKNAIFCNHSYVYTYELLFFCIFLINYAFCTYFYGVVFLYYFIVKI